MIIKKTKRATLAGNKKRKTRRRLLRPKLQGQREEENEWEREKKKTAYFS